jgi:hypothetical protein
MANSLTEIREYAKSVGIFSAHKYQNMEDLIRTIQVAEGNYDCFKRAPDCKDSDCRWLEDCK